MAKDTKNRILDAALDMFSQNGYAGTNIRELAESLGLGKSSLYRHYESKEEIWNAVFDAMIDYYDEHFGSVDKLSGIPKNTDDLRDMTYMMIDFTVHDEKIIKMRKILTTEQFRDERVRDLSSRYFLYDTKEIFTRIFAEMMKNGSLKKDDPEILAFEYTAPVTALIHLCDRDPNKEPEAMETMKRFVDHFIDTYGTES